MSTAIPQASTSACTENEADKGKKTSKIIEEETHDRTPARLILCSIWAILLLLGVPFWLLATSTERLPLPETRVQQWRADSIHFSSHETAIDDSRVVGYAPQYKVVFSLLLQEPAEVPDVDLMSHIADSVYPLMESLQGLHAFEVETHVQYYAPLASELDVSDGLLSEEDIKAFVNSAQWSLSTAASLNPTLHFILYAPNKPLAVQSEHAQHSSFIIPQWGGVYLLPSLDPSALSSAFDTFCGHMALLLGLFQQPSHNSVASLMKARILEASQDATETLHATVALVRKQTSLRINADVRSAVYRSLDALDNVQSRMMSLEDLPSALDSAREAMQCAREAFFHPSMLALLYFPDEHRLAVYTPLFGPVALPLLIATVKEVRAWVSERRKIKAE